jgi:TRAP-type mannitol/chloroaromatic compound transport system substrate-binding protein
MNRCPEGRPDVSIEKSTLLTPAPTTENEGPSRRRFITGAAATTTAGAAAIAFPHIAKGQETWTMQAGWPTGDILWEYAQDLVAKINEMSGGRLNINLLPAGAVVGALELQDAVVGGALDGSHGVTAYWYGKNKAASLFGTPPAFGWNAHEFMGWMWYGGGQELYEELVQDILGLNLAGFLYGPMPTQAFGWFREPISSVDQLSGLRYRTVGLAADLYEELGAAVTILGGPDIVPALDRGVIDAAEFNNPSSDRALGFQDVAKNWMLQSFHQDCEVFEVNFNRERYENLDDDLKAIVRYATYAAHADMAWKAQHRYPQDQRWLVEEAGVTLYKTPDAILQAQLEAWDAVIERNSAENEFFARVIESQREWARDVVGFMQVNEAPKDMAYQHFFGEPPLPAQEVT